jgi:predicted nucleic acid-binding Zn ribbon protein
VTEPEPRGSDDDGRTAGSESEASRVYRRLREVFGADAPRRRRKKEREERSGGLPFGKGRDPHPLGDVFDSLTVSLGWTAPLAQSDLMASWTAIAGEETAKHSRPLGVDEGVLTVACESTAWATQLRLMRVEIMNHIARNFPDAGIDSVRFQGPDVPNWKKGPRSIPGRGPRDTYG